MLNYDLNFSKIEGPDWNKLETKTASIVSNIY